jgi:hypothetical protein
MNGKIAKRMRKYAVIVSEQKGLPVETDYEITTYTKYDQKNNGEVFEYKVYNATMKPCLRSEYQKIKRQEL